MAFYCSQGVLWQSCYFIFILGVGLCASHRYGHACLHEYHVVGWLLSSVFPLPGVVYLLSERMYQNCDCLPYARAFPVLWSHTQSSAVCDRVLCVTVFHFLYSRAGESDEREQSKLEVKVWDPNSPLTDRQIDQFLVVAR